MSTTLVWFEHDLRLSDHPALDWAAKRGAVVPVVIWSPDEAGDWPPGSASRWWLHHSLTRLGEALAKLGSPLVIRRGADGGTLHQLEHLIEETGADAVAWNCRYEPAAIARDQKIEARLRACGLTVQTFHGNVLFPPGSVQTKSGGPFQVFTPFWDRCRAMGTRPLSLPLPHKLQPPKQTPQSLSIDQLALLPRVRWDAGLTARWQPGEAGAMQKLNEFVSQRMSNYEESRNRPDQVGTSSLSPHLHFGEISPGQIWHAVESASCQTLDHTGADRFLAEIGWREFAIHLLHHFPRITAQPLRAAFANFPWRDDPADLKAWQTGHTGYPIIDAGMRELWATGWMHNRVRMLVGSFLTKHLRLTWQSGAAWFWDTLVDADLASNSLGWQWIAGCGADAAPYFRIFNPVIQGERFDPDGHYVRRWVPELQDLPTKYIHQPWSATPSLLKKHGVTLGSTYPEPIVNHATARAAALAAFATLRN